MAQDRAVTASSLGMVAARLSGSHQAASAAAPMQAAAMIKARS
jgi:hypothetical protein